VANAINNRSEVVGDMVGANGRFNGFLWRNGHATELGQMNDGEDLFARDINSQGQIVLERFRNSYAEGPFPFVRWGRHERKLKPLPGSSGRHATSINEFGIVAGSVETAEGRQDGAIWIGNHPIDLGREPIGDPATATAINAWMQVAGTSSADGSFRTTAWLWQFGTLTVLPTLNNDPANWSTRADDINNFGQIVGAEIHRYFNQRTAVLWHDNAAFDLNDLVDSNDPLKPYVKLLQATQINNRGWIVANGVDSRSPNFSTVPYLLAPVGE
jgi:uncharacterized membrane protein